MVSWHRKKVKTYWLLINLVLLAFASLLPLSFEGFWGNVSGICFGALIIQSYPLSILPLSLLFWSGIYADQVILMIFAAPICLATGYLQWFIIVPRLVKFIKKTFFRYDWQVNLRVTAPDIKTLPDAQPDIAAQDWQKSWYDAQKRTPVERVFEKDED